MRCSSLAHGVDDGAAHEVVPVRKELNPNGFRI